MEKLPVLPTRQLRESGFFISTEVGVGKVLSDLDKAILENRTMRVSPGTKVKMVFWNGVDGVVAGFRPDGVQVAFGIVQFYPDPNYLPLLDRDKKDKVITYNTSYIVGTGYQGQGLGKEMKEMLENYVAANNVGIGAGFFSEVQAQTPQTIAAARRILRGIGALRVQQAKETETYMRMIYKPKFRKGSNHPRGTTVLSTDNPPSVSFYSEQEKSKKKKSRKRH